MTQEYIYICIYTLNPVESNYRDGPTGHKKKKKKNYHVNLNIRCMDVKTNSSTQKYCANGRRNQKYFLLRNGYKIIIKHNIFMQYCM